MILDEFTPNNLYEMSNFGHRVTGLPPSITLWVRTETKQMPHSNYRIKVDKGNQYAAIFSVAQAPSLLKHSNKNKLTANEISDIADFIGNYSSLIISHIDGKLDSGELALEILKFRGST